MENDTIIQRQPVQVGQSGICQKFTEELPLLYMKFQKINKLNKKEDYI